MPIHLPTHRRQDGMKSIFYLTKATSRKKQGKTHVIAEARECKVAIGGQILLNKSRRIGKK